MTLTLFIRTLNRSRICITMASRELVTLASHTMLFQKPKQDFPKLSQSDYDIMCSKLAGNWSSSKKKYISWGRLSLTICLSTMVCITSSTRDLCSCFHSFLRDDCGFCNNHICDLLQTLIESDGWNDGETSTVRVSENHGPSDGKRFGEQTRRLLHHHGSRHDPNECNRCVGLQDGKFAKVVPDLISLVSMYSGL